MLLRLTRSLCFAPPFVALSLLLVPPACGGAVEGDNLAPPGPGDDGGYRFYGTPVGDGGRRDARGQDGSGDATFIDPACGDVQPRPPQNACDANTQTGCKTGEGCYPLTIYPTGPCEQERYGTRCERAGTGTQGTSCDGIVECAAGYVCVISGSGTQCAKLCMLGRSGQCPEGLVCEPIDVAGYATCF